MVSALARKRRNLDSADGTCSLAICNREAVGHQSPGLPLERQPWEMHQDSIPQPQRGCG